MRRGGEWEVGLWLGYKGIVLYSEGFEKGIGT
jgi:hypothetical protein